MGPLWPLRERHEAAGAEQAEFTVARADAGVVERTRRAASGFRRDAKCSCAMRRGKRDDHLRDVA